MSLLVHAECLSATSVTLGSSQASLGSSSSVCAIRVGTAGHDPVVDKTILLFVVLMNRLVIPRGQHDKERNSNKEQLEPAPWTFVLQNTCILSLARNGGVVVASKERENLA